MATIINNPGNTEGGGSSIAVIVGVIVLVAIVGLFFVYGLPAMRSGTPAPQETAIDVNVKLPVAEIPTPAPAPAPAPAP